MSDRSLIRRQFSTGKCTCLAMAADSNMKDSYEISTQIPYVLKTEIKPSKWETLNQAKWETWSYKEVSFFKKIVIYKLLSMKLW